MGAGGGEGAVEIVVEPHPLMCVRAFVARFDAGVGESASPPWLVAMLASDAPEVGLERDEALRAAVREGLRWGGYRPTGRGKPASEYLVRAAAEGGLRPINVAVDACNAISLASGIPISVVDLDRARPPLRVAIAGEGAEYVFNAGGQVIGLAGLVCLVDAQGPCANAVKDAQRTKTGEGTRATLSVLWGVKAFAERVERAERRYREVLERAGARVEDVRVVEG